MKKVFLALAVVTVALVACNNVEKKAEETKGDSPENSTAKTTADSLAKVASDSLAKVVADSLAKVATKTEATKTEAPAEKK